MNNLVERSLQLFHFLSTQTSWNKCPSIWSLQLHSLFQETKNWFLSRECRVSTTNSTGTNVSSFFPFLCHSAGPVLASSFPSGNKLSLPSRDATHRLNNKTIHVAGKNWKRHLLASPWHLKSYFLYWISLYGQEDALSSWIAPKSGVLRLFLLRHEHCDSQSWVIMRLESENGSSTILTLYPRAHLPTSFLPFLLLGWDAMTKATHRREFAGVYSSRVQSMRIMSGIMVAGRHGADIVNWELIAWSTSRRPFRERPWE